jgi:GT2 family glycosyltransferase
LVTSSISIHPGEEVNRYNAKVPSSETFPKVSIIIVNTNELHHLRRCLPSIINQHYSNYEVLVIDNASTDGSINYIGENYPNIRVIRNKTNLGYAGANNVGFHLADQKYIAVLNPDTEVDPDWLQELVAALESNKKAGLATPKILLMDNPQLINACGNNITYSGLTVCRGLEQPAEKYTEPAVVPAVSGAAFVIKKEVLDKIGGFDENFFIYYEETDLSLRAMLAGYQCLFVPTSIVFHKYAFRFTPKKCFYQERNRYYSLLKTFKWPTFFVLLPELFISELLAWGYVILKGPKHIQSKFQSYLWLIENRNLISESRRQTQKLRVLSDHAILKSFSHQLTFAQTTSPVLAKILETVINPLLFILGKVSCAIVLW